MKSFSHLMDAGVYEVTVLVPAGDAAYVPVPAGIVTADNILEEFEGFAEYEGLEDGSDDVCADGCCINFAGRGPLTGTIVKVSPAPAFRAMREEAQSLVTATLMSAIFAGGN